MKVGDRRNVNGYLVEITKRLSAHIWETIVKVDDAEYNRVFTTTELRELGFID